MVQLLTWVMLLALLAHLLDNYFSFTPAVFCLLLRSWGKAGRIGNDICTENSCQVGKVFWKETRPSGALNKMVRGCCSHQPFLVLPSLSLGLWRVQKLCSFPVI